VKNFQIKHLNSVDGVIAATELNFLRIGKGVKMA